MQWIELFTEIFHSIDWSWGLKMFFIFIFGIAVFGMSKKGITEEIDKHPFETIGFQKIKWINIPFYYCLYILPAIGLCALVSAFTGHYGYKLFPLSVFISLSVVIYYLTKEIFRSRSNRN